jgi:hypothetical protein
MIASVAAVLAVVLFALIEGQLITREDGSGISLRAVAPALATVS